MKICCLGGCGYIGSRLIPFLLADGHKVVCVDTQWFGEGAMSDNGSLTVAKHDVRGLGFFEDQEAVIHLASISNNDMYASRPLLTESVNQWIPAGRVIYASSVAAYGTSDKWLTEDSPLKPTTPYGKDKAYCEEIVLRNGGTVVRAASVCGHSPNMRFDTPTNRMTRAAMTGNKIEVNGGEQVRCHIDIDALCEFYCLLLKAPQDKISSHAFNAVGESMKIKTTAKTVARFFDNAQIDYRPATDERSYMVAGTKALEVLGWKPKRQLENSILGMKARKDNPQYRDFSPARMRML